MPESPVMIPLRNPSLEAARIPRRRFNARDLHPHPLFGGSMDNNVVIAVSARCGTAVMEPCGSTVAGGPSSASIAAPRGCGKPAACV